MEAERGQRFRPATTVSGSDSIPVEELDHNLTVIAAIGYLFPPVVPIIVLTSDLKQNDALRRHALQALYWTIGFVVLLVLAVVALIWLVRLDFLAICLLPVLLTLPFVPGAIWAKRVYFGQPVTIRLLSRLAR